MPTLVHFGAGNIGRSLVAPLFTQAGFEVVFVEAQAALVDALNARRGYLLRLKDELPPGVPAEVPIRHVRALPAGDFATVAQAVAEADLLSTAVGPRVLPKLWPVLAAGLARRSRPVSILFCENQRGLAALARTALQALLPPDFPLDRVGLVETSIGKMVPLIPEAVRQRDPLEVWAEAYNQIVADAEGFAGPVPEVPGLVLKQHFRAYVDRKLFVHNLGHAAAAYHGFLAGKTYIWECMAEPRLYAEAEAAMAESALALLRRYPGVFSAAEQDAHIADLLRRFGNRALGDTVFRVGRDLARKLAPEDRCVGALRLVEATGGVPDAICRSIGVALHFRATDEQGQPCADDTAFLARLERLGPETLLHEHCGLRPAQDGQWLERILAAYRSPAFG